MKFPLMTVLVITDEPKKWAHEVLKFLNKYQPKIPLALADGMNGEM